MIDHDEHASRARQAYERDAYQAHLAAVLTRTRALVEQVLRTDLGEQEFSVSARVKHPASFEQKAATLSADGYPKYLRPLAAIHDQVALRVIVLHTGYLSVARDLIQSESGLVVEEYENKSNAHSLRRSFGYSGHHLVVRPVETGVPCPDHECGSLERVEIQVRTHAQHAWAEVEHDLRYKNADLDAAASRDLDRVAALLETADDILERLVDSAVARAELGDADVAAPVRPTSAAAPSMTLAVLLERQFPGARQPKPTSLAWITACAASLDLEDAGAIDAVLREAPLDRIEAVFRSVGHSPRSQIRQLDDALLWHGRDRYLEAAEAGVEGTSDRYRRGRPGILRWRLDRLRDAGVIEA